MLNEKLPIVPAAYAWIRRQDVPETSIFIPLPCEDNNKKERTILEIEPVQLSDGMLGIFSGKIDPEEDPFTTIWRETGEEWQVGVDRNWISNGLPKFNVEAHRDEGTFILSAIGHTLKLPAHRIVELQSRTPIIEVKDGALPQFLREYRNRLRPHVYLAGQLILRRRQLS